MDNIWQSISSEYDEGVSAVGIPLTPQHALTPLQLYEWEDSQPKLLQLSVEDWGRVYDPPLRPQQPPTPLPHEEEPFEV
jgi:hypothetical protein